MASALKRTVPQQPSRTWLGHFWARALVASQRPPRALLLCARDRDTPTLRAPTPAIFVPPSPASEGTPITASAQSRIFLSLRKASPSVRLLPILRTREGVGSPTAGAGAGAGEEELPWEVLPAVSPWARDPVVSSVTMWPVMGRLDTLGNLAVKGVKMQRPS